MSLEGILVSDLEGVLVKNSVNTDSGTVAIKNLLSNSGAYGGSASTLPTDWDSAAEGTATIEVVDYGDSPIFEGAKYVDLQIINNDGVNRNLTVKLDINTIAGVQNDDFAYSAYLQVISGTLTGAPRFMMIELQGAVFKATVADTDLSIDETLSRKTTIYTVSDVNTDRIQAWLRFYDVTDESDFTIRLTCPQVEKSSAVTNYQNTGF